jgi:GNAT superfamily N-acetyltransferase
MRDTIDSQKPEPSLIHAEPVLAVSNVVETVAYWHEVLGFPEKWTWGNPVNHGGVSWKGTAFIQFSLDPERVKISQGHSVWIRARNLSELYQLHEERKAKIISPIVNRPWGAAEYTVQDINGYYVNFSAPAAEKNRQDEKLPLSVRITARTPSLNEYKHLMDSVGWSVVVDDASVHAQFKAIAFAVVAEEILTGEAIGCAFLLGDNISFYYVKDVIVHPKWQGKRIGTTMMQEMMRWLDINAPENATVGLFTGDHLAAFYRQFGFIQACGMYKQILRGQKK